MGKQPKIGRHSKSARAKGPAIVLVEARRNVLALLEEALGRDYNLRSFPNAGAALEGLAAAPADIVIADRTAAGMDGAVFFSKAARIAPDARQIVLTGRVGMKAVVEAVNEGRIDFFVLKPVVKEEILQAIEEIWRTRQLERERARLSKRNREIVEELRGLNAQLEAKVKERTRQLSRSNRDLQGVAREMKRKNAALTALNKQLQIQATVDPLTELFNRREFNQRLKTEWARFERHKRPLSLIMADIDLFKKINDSYGHECGDEVLRSLAKLMKRLRRRHDLLCRFGGEEFIALLPETGLEEAFGVAERLRTEVAAHPFRCGTRRPRVRVSLGVAGALEQNPRNEDDLIKLADLAMYRAKEEGRDRTVAINADRRGEILRISG